MAAKLVGQNYVTPDLVAKVTGRAVYADDLVLPRMLHAKLKRSIHPHARLVSIDASTALAMPGVHAVHRLPGAVAVTADSWWRARKAVEAAK